MVGLQLEQQHWVASWNLSYSVSESQWNIEQFLSKVELNIVICHWQADQQLILLAKEDQLLAKAEVKWSTIIIIIVLRDADKSW